MLALRATVSATELKYFLRFVLVMRETFSFKTELVWLKTLKIHLGYSLLRFKFLFY